MPQTPWPRRIIAGVASISAIRFRHAYQRDLFLVLTIGASVFYLLALYTFHPQDTSWMAASHPQLPAQNLAGHIGAGMAGLAIFVFGVAAWLLPLPFVTTALLTVRMQTDAFAKARWFGWFIVMACAAAGLTTFMHTIRLHGLELPAGGVIGQSIVKFLLHWLGEIGSLVVLATVSCGGLLMVLRRSIFVPIGYWMKMRSTNMRESLGAWQMPKFSYLLKKSKAADDGYEPMDDYEPAPPPPVAPAIEPVMAEPVIGDALAAAVPEAPRPAQGQLFPDHAIPSAGESLKAYSETHKSIREDSSDRPSLPYLPPPSSIFARSSEDPGGMAASDLERTAALLVDTFEDFGVKGKVIGYQPGPVVTVYEYQPDAGIKQSKIQGLIDDIALALKVDSIFINPVRGKRALGVQVPNAKRQMVYLGDIVESRSFRSSSSSLTFAMGKTLNGQALCADLTTMPHLLAAGATGSGKSVAVNALLCSVIMKAKPDDVKMILVDPKMLELAVYEGIPHLMMPVITDPQRASLALKWATNEMERRYRLMQLACVRNITGFNQWWAKATPAQKQELRVQMEDDSIDRLPYLLVVIDELADLMMTAPKDVESSIQRLAQKARASGIHMVLATQRPSVDIITGVIKANLPCRVAFQVVSKHDSRTILDLNGAEKLLGKGDMLLQRPGIGRLERIQGALISDEEVLNLVAAVKRNSQAAYDQNMMAWIDDEVARQDEADAPGGVPKMDDDPKYDEAVTIAQTHGVVSASFLQRHLKIGYNRAARIVEFMQAQGLVDKADGAKPRKWLGPPGQTS